MDCCLRPAALEDVARGDEGRSVEDADALRREVEAGAAPGGLDVLDLDRG
jgi:hypothetical protein